MAGMFKVNRTNSGYPSVKRDCQYIQENKEAIITHTYETEGEDSGTPIIIQPDKCDKQCFLIGVH